MYSYTMVFFLAAAAITLSFSTISMVLTIPAMASSSKGGGSVDQEKVNTGNPNLDKQINKFYSCISKTHQDPPTIEKVYNCYYQSLDDGTTSNYRLTGTRATSTINSKELQK